MSATTKTPAEQLERANRALLIFSQTPRTQYSTELCDMLGESLRAALEQLDAAQSQDDLRITVKALEGALTRTDAENDRLRAALTAASQQWTAPAPGQQWKCGAEFLPFHPQASHVPPDYRDGWNHCYEAAKKQAAATTGESQQ